VIRKFAGGAEH
jgi:AP-4 complex subunit mu-1